MRVFVGLELGEEANEALATFQNDLRPYVERGNFTRKENFHLTLWFIGETDSAQVSMITHALEDIARHFAPFEIELGDLNAFQKKNRKILWIGPSSGLYHLEKLYDALEKDFRHIGIHKEPEAFTPHITLGRQLSLLDTVQNLRERHTVKPVKCHIGYITVFESKRVKDLLTYVPIKRVKLNE
ncbi:RNA 2',3'-cyclic phosphodiesterase [Fusibacter sp. JL216-2]|uniref:RNA 2',3'-cyclic phosphodiesterase n=1 Tax=Fusibacter sp. JL216-2 TaxID=3071453 RepID=UPI003D3549B4